MSGRRGGTGRSDQAVMATTKPLTPFRLVAVLGATAPAVAIPYVFHACWLVSPATGAAIRPLLLPVCAITALAACSL